MVVQRKATYYAVNEECFVNGSFYRKLESIKANGKTSIRIERWMLGDYLGRYTEVPEGLEMFVRKPDGMLGM